MGAMAVLSDLPADKYFPRVVQCYAWPAAIMHDHGPGVAYGGLFTEKANGTKHRRMLELGALYLIRVKLKDAAYDVVT